MALFGGVDLKASAPLRMNLVTNRRKLHIAHASIGRSSGGVHGYRSRKGRRRRAPRSERVGSENQDEVQAASKFKDDDFNSSQSKSSSRSKRSVKQEEEEGRFDSEVVAPVAVTILSDPELFESVSQEHQQASENENGQQSSTAAVWDKDDPIVVEDVPGNIVEQVAGIQTQVAEQVSHVVHKVVEEVLPEQVTQVAEDLVEQVVAHPVVEQVAKVTEHVTNLLASEHHGSDQDPETDDEFEAYTTSDLPEFRGIRGIENFTVLQESHGIVTMIHDFYLYILKKPLLEFALGMFVAPVAVSMLFTLLYLPQIRGLDFASNLGLASSSLELGMKLDWETVFLVFMFSVSLSTGLEPELTPRTPYTLVVANINALVAQLLFVFLSGAVFARLSQPSQPIRCSLVAVVSPFTPRKDGQSPVRVFMARYVLSGPQPCELVDVKVDLTYKHNTITRAGTFFRATQSLKLIRSEVAYLTHGMLVRHVIDESSPLNKRTPEMLRKEDGVFTLSVVGLERSSMQSVFHAQHYSMDDDHVIWDADFQDMILISKKNRRIVDHSKLSQWRHVKATSS